MPQICPIFFGSQVRTTALISDATEINTPLRPTSTLLQRKGMIYTRAISNAPVCAPARTTIISGMYPTFDRIRAYAQHDPATIQVQNVSAYLRELGYYCTNNSKEDYNLMKEGEVWDESGRKANWENRPSKDKPFFAIYNFTVSHESQIRKRPHSQVP